MKNAISTFLLLFGNIVFLHAQPCTATITPGGPTVFCEGASVLLNANTGDSWTQKADAGTLVRKGAVGFSIGTKGYIGTGYIGVPGFTDFWEYDPSTNVWTQKANFGGTGRGEAACFSIGTKGYVGTGQDAVGPVKDFWEYNPAANTWTRKADFGGTERYNATGFSIGTKGYIGTGIDAGGNTKDFWEYNPVTDTWVRKADFATQRYACAGFSIAGKGYLGTGFETATNSRKKDFWEYNPVTDTWLRKADFGGVARNSAVGFSIGSRGYIGTGSGGIGIYTKDFWQYDPVTDTWLQKADFGGTGRYIARGFSIGSKGYLGTGSSGPSLRDFWEYDPDYSYTWSTGAVTSSITAAAAASYSVTVTDNNGCTAVSAATLVSFYPSPSAVISPGGTVNICSGGNVGLSASLLPDTWTQKADAGTLVRKGAVGFSIGNKGYIGTGYIGVPGFTDFWEYDPSTNVWTQKANFGGTGRGEAACFSIGTKGYVGTGQDAVGPVKDFWEYNPAANTWTRKADFGGTERYNATGFSIGTKGYIGTGIDAGGNTKDFWEYNPVTDTWVRKADFATQRYACAGFSIAGKGYLGTGFETATNSRKKDFWEYNPVTDTWLRKADFGGVARNSAVGFSIGSRGYIGTGSGGIGIYTKDFWQYDPVTDTWLQKADFGGTGRYIARGFSIGSKGYLGTGSSGPSLRDFWEYDPDYSYTWSTGAVTSSITATAAGSYTVTVTNGNGCSTVAVATLVNTVSPSPIISPAGIAAICAGDNINLSAAATDSWAQKANFGGVARDRAAGFSIGTKGYIGTGFDGAYKKDFWEYDPNSNVWMQKADFGGVARSRAVGFSIGTKGYIGTGFNGAYRSDFWEYDPVANAWIQKANFGGGLRQFAVGFVIDAKGYVGTGSDGANKKDFWQYDPATDSWVQKADFGGVARFGAAGFAAGGKGYIGTGLGGTNRKDFWEYDPATNTWLQRADFGGTARAEAFGTSIGNKGYIGLGTDGARQNDFWEYNPATNTWTAKANYGGTASRSVAGFSIGAKIYAGTGNDVSYKNDWWVYDPGYTYSWSTGATTASINVTTAANYTVALTDVLGCSATSPATTVTINTTNTWNGGGTSDWNTAANWSCGIVPDNTGIDAVIVNGASPMPVINADVTIRNLVLNGTATLALNDKKLTIGGTVTGTGSFTGTAASMLTLNGAAGNIKFSAGSALLQDLLLGANASATLAGPLNISAGSNAGSVIVGSGGVLNTGNNLVLRSDALGTARIGNTAGIINGDVTVERFIPARRSWRLLTAPLSSTATTTISQAWQDGQQAATIPPPVYTAGSGTLITSGTSAVNGYDKGSTNNPSLKFYNGTAWAAPANTTMPIKTHPGYMLFVRGDRNVSIAGTGVVANTTTLRPKGAVNLGPQSITAAGAGFKVIGNPYASAINFHTTIKSGLPDQYRLWDPKIGGIAGVGGFVTFAWNSLNNNYDRTVTGAGSTALPQDGTIQSGAAFVVNFTGAGSLQINETDKLSSSAAAPFGRPAPPSAAEGRLSANLGFYDSDGSLQLLDGVLFTFHSSYQNELDAADAIKMTNVNEDFGINKKGTIIAIERRSPIRQNDTLFFKFSQPKLRTYILQLLPQHLATPGLTAFIDDAYTNTQTEISLEDTSYYAFATSNDAVASYAADRIRLVFKTSSIDSSGQAFLQLSARQQNNAIAIEWKINSEQFVGKYEIERSVNGIDFINIAGIVPDGSELYQWLDEQPAQGNNFYRIKKTGTNGEFEYSGVVSAGIGKTGNWITVYPNPVTGGIINLRMKNDIAGNYSFKLVNSLGKVVYAAVINHTGVESARKVQIPNIINGYYQLEISNRSGQKLIYPLFIQTK